MYEIYERLLKERGLTTYQVSKATGISQQTLSNWKVRGNALRMDKLQIIADYFGVPVDYLMTGDPKYIYYAYVQEVEPTLTKEENEMVRAFRNADELTQQMVLRILGLEKSANSDLLKEA